MSNVKAEIHFKSAIDLKEFLIQIERKPIPETPIPYMTLNGEFTQAELELAIGAYSAIVLPTPHEN